MYIGRQTNDLPTCLPAHPPACLTYIPPPFSCTRSLDSVPGLITPAATIAVLAAIESLLCARVADTMLGSSGGDKHDSNTELISQVGARAAGALGFRVWVRAHARQVL